MTDYNINVVVNDSQANRKLKTFDKNLKNTATAADRLRSTILKAVAVLGGAALFRSATRSAIEYQKALAEVSSLVDTATFDLEALNKQALENARIFGSAPVEQVKAFYSIISAGAGTAAEAIDILDTANKAAIAGVTDVQTASLGLVSVLNSYNLEAADAATVSDTLFVTVREGQTTFEELARSLGNVTPLANAAGVSLQEVNAAVGALTTGGITTSQAVTGLRAVIQGVLQPAGQAAEKAKSLGLEFSAAALEADGLEGFLQKVIERTQGNTDTITQLFGSVEALNAVLALSGPAGQKFSDILDSLRDSAGATDEAFDKLSKTPGFQIDRILKGISAASTEAVSSFLNDLVPTLTFVADNLDEFINIAGDVATVLGVTWATIAIPKAILAIKALGFAISTNPIGALLTVTVAATTALVTFRDNIERLGGPLETLKKLADAAFSGLAKLFPALERLQRTQNDFAQRRAQIASEARAGIDELLQQELSPQDALRRRILAAQTGFGSGSPTGTGENLALSPQDALRRRILAAQTGFESGSPTGAGANLGQGIAEAAVPALKEFELAVDSGTESVSTLSQTVQEEASFIKDSLEGAFNQASNALSNFIRTGTFNFENFTRSILDNLTQIASNQLFEQLKTSLFASSGGGGGGNNFLSNVFGSFTNLFGFANGGSFQVAGAGGVDRNIMSLNGTPVARVSRGEMVNVSPNTSGTGTQRPIVINFQISSPNGQIAQQTQEQIASKAAQAIRRADRRDN